MRRALQALLILSVACATSKTPNAPHEDPEVQIQQLSAVASAARHVTGGIPVQFAISIHNTTSTPLKLKRADVQSMGMGAYALPPASKPFDVTIDRGETKTVEMWGSANIDETTIVGANGPVTIRATLNFEGPDRQFQTIVVRQVHAGGGVGD